MRTLTLIPLALLTTACLASGERDPTRYPWDPRNDPRNKVAAAADPHPRIVAKGQLAPDPSWQGRSSR